MCGRCVGIFKKTADFLESMAPYSLGPSFFPASRLPQGARSLYRPVQLVWRSASCSNLNDQLRVLGQCCHLVDDLAAISDNYLKGAAQRGGNEMASLLLVGFGDN